MIISIHQPQYFPWLPYFSKIARSDLFIFLDKVQYQKNGLQNRNELKNSNGRFWLTIPVSFSLGENICDIKMAGSDWSKKHLKSIRINYSKAKNLLFFEENIAPILSNNILSLSELNIEIIKTISKNFFELNTKFINQSEISTTEKGSDLILEICKKVNAVKYLSGPNGKNYLNETSFSKNNIEIEYLKNELPNYYPQQHPKIGFINDISALDFILNMNMNWSEYYKL